MKNLSFILALSIAVSACATVKSSGVQQIGQDSYTVTVSYEGLKFAGEDNSAKTRAKAINDANEFCRARGDSYADINKENVVRSETATALIYFRCSQ